jgi:GT2 family glycosyltransferase
VSIQTTAIAMVTYNSDEDLARHLEGYVNVARELEVPFVVVDNDSRDGTRTRLEQVRGRYSGMQVVRMSQNVGYAGGVNAAFSAVPGHDVLLLNPDVAPPSAEEVLALASVLRAEPSIAVAAPRMVGDDGEPQLSARRFPTLMAIAGSTATARRAGVARRSHRRYVAPADADQPRTVDWVIGGAMLIRREAYVSVHGWDERFFLYVEDVDFCRRCRKLG